MHASQSFTSLVEELLSISLKVVLRFKKAFAECKSGREG